MAICATNWEGSVHFQLVSGGSCWFCRDDEDCVVMMMMKMASNDDDDDGAMMMTMAR